MSPYKMKRKDYQQNIRALIILFYGLAIATGLEYSIPKILPESGDYKNFTQLFPFVFLSLAIALSDWVMYFTLAAQNKYKNIARVVLDILFPIFIYFLFVLISNVELYIIFFTLYFFLSIIYLLLLKADKETANPPKIILIPNLGFTFSGLILIFILYCNLFSNKLENIISILFSLIVGLIWLCCSFYYLNTKLEETKDKTV